MLKDGGSDMEGGKPLEGGNGRYTAQKQSSCVISYGRLIFCITNLFVNYFFH